MLTVAGHVLDVLFASPLDGNYCIPWKRSKTVFRRVLLKHDETKYASEGGSNGSHPVNRDLKLLQMLVGEFNPI